MSYTQLKEVPDLMRVYRSLLADQLPIVGTRRVAKNDPTSAFEVTGVKADPAHLGAYADTTGLRLGNTLPLTYPYVLAFPLAMQLMEAEDFPFPAIGVVHISNVIEQRRPIGFDEVFDLRARSGNLRGHRRGLLIDVRTELLIGGEVVWSQKSTFLGPGAKLSSKAHHSIVGRGYQQGQHLERRDVPEVAATAQWRVTPAQISAYARASGDKNPIHTSSIGAKLFGMPNAIAHGMWTAAAMLAPLEGRLGRGILRYTVDFAKPVVLPAQVSYWAQHSDEGWRLDIRQTKNPEKVHASALVEELD